MSMRKCVVLAGAIMVVASGHARAGSLYSDLGERPGLVRLTDRVMQVWLADPRVAPSFEDSNTDRIKGQLVEQLCSITGGGCVYKGQSMADAHRGLHLATRQFNAATEDLQTAMEQVDLPYTVQNRLIALLAPMRRDVVTR